MRLVRYFLDILALLLALIILALPVIDIISIVLIHYGLFSSSEIIALLILNTIVLILLIHAMYD